MDEYRALRRLSHFVAGVLPLAVGRYRHDRAYRADRRNGGNGGNGGHCPVNICTTRKMP